MKIKKNIVNFFDFYQIIAKNQLSHWLETVPAQIAVWEKGLFHKQFRKWINVVELLPKIKPYNLDLLYSVTAKSKNPLSKGQKMCIENLMRNLTPWRKGPFSLYGLNINAEWRSDWKWQRILPFLSDLKGRIVLDVGCGSGYYLWRMIGAGAHLAIGIDPTSLFLFQFEAVRKLLFNDQRVHLLPIGIEKLPKLSVFDTVFSMGVLCHRRSPLEHLWQLKDQLVNGGELILETIIVEGNECTILVPNNRYAKMKNIYFIPSVKALKNWLSKCGFCNIRIVNVCVTTTEEQRRTDWMTNESLEDFLDPKDQTKTIEGYPAPVRAILIATKP